MTPLNLNKNNPANTSIRILVLVFSLGVTLGSGLAHGYHQATGSLNQKQPPDQTEIRRVDVNRADYERLKPGMSLTAVEAILGSGTEIKRSSTTATFVWENADDSRISATFQNEVLVGKEQFKLR